MPRKQKKHHYIYKTTCQVTGKFYIGMHSTDNLEDGYLGSGKILGYSIGKHGRENHKREILERCENREALKLREAAIVNEQLLADPLNINLKYGGEGGSHGKESEVWKRTGFKEKVAVLQGIGLKRKWQDAEYRNKISSSAKKRGAEMWERDFEKMRAGAMIGIKAMASDKSKAKRKATYDKHKHQQGEKNSSFGTCWVTNEHRPIKIKKELLEQYLQRGFLRGRKK